MPQKTCNLQAVAHALGLSRSTVSLAMRGDARIPAATRQRVQRQAEEMGYAANPLIATLMSSLRQGGARPGVTMAEIARRAGVSRAMVSLVLRHPGRGAPATVRRVNAAARALGYRRDPLHAAFVTYRRRHAHRDKHTTIAFVATHPAASPWRRFRSYVQMFEGAARRARELGYRLEEFKCSSDGMSPQRLRSVLLARNIHALVVAPLPGRLTHFEFDVDSFACVGLGSGFRDPPFECVSNDQFQSIGLAMQKCVERGLRRVGLVVSRAASERLGGRWLAGYLFAQQATAGCRRLPPLMPDSDEEIGSQLPGWLRQHRPDVVIFAQNELEKSVFLPLRAKVGIVSLHVMDPDGPVSGVYQASDEVGAQAVDLVVSRLQNYGTKPNSAPGTYFVPGRWVEGRTVRAVT
jgi:DNA-binding LacI/PurR family transcriptional regulator